MLELPMAASHPGLIPPIPLKQLDDLSNLHARFPVVAMGTAPILAPPTILPQRHDRRPIGS
jgi:hypothetical protein